MLDKDLIRYYASEIVTLIANSEETPERVNEFIEELKSTASLRLAADSLADSGKSGKRFYTWCSCGNLFLRPELGDSGEHYDAPDGGAYILYATCPRCKKKSYCGCL